MRNTTDEAIPLQDREQIIITVDVKLIRMRLGLSQEDFSEFYKIPLDLIQEWETGRSRPDGASQTYLRLIAKEPELIKSKLNAA